MTASLTRGVLAAAVALTVANAFLAGRRAIVVGRSRSRRSRTLARPPRPAEGVRSRIDAVVRAARRRLGRRRREAARVAAVPGVLESVARALRAGASLAEALASVDAPPPLAEDWSTLVQRGRAAGVVAAAGAWASDDPVPAVRLAAGALSLGAAVGGAHARALDGVAATLRARRAVAEEVTALSSQARASAAVIALAPLVFCVLAATSDPRLAAFYGSPAGFLVIGAGVALDAAGAAWMAHITRTAAP